MRGAPECKTVINAIDAIKEDGNPICNEKQPFHYLLVTVFIPETKRQEHQQNEEQIKIKHARYIKYKSAFEDLYPRREANFMKI